MHSDDQRHSFSHVDEAENPQRLVQQMDRLRSMDPFLDVKRQNFALLRSQAGYRLLDVGCGPGDDARAMAEMVGPEGLVVGVDASDTMLTEARKRSEGTNLHVEFRRGDAESLPFDDNTFDGSRSDRMFQHLADPAQGLREMVRVTKPGGRIAVSDTDWGMLGLDTDNRDLTRRVATVQADAMQRNGWIGRQLPRLFKQAGLQDVAIVPHVIVNTKFETIKEYFLIMVDVAQKQSVITAEEASAWMADLEQRAQGDLFFSALVMFTVAGTKASANAAS